MATDDDLGEVDQIQAGERRRGGDQADRLDRRRGPAPPDPSSSVVATPPLAPTSQHPTGVCGMGGVLGWGRRRRGRSSAAAGKPGSVVVSFVPPSRRVKKATAGAAPFPPSIPRDPEIPHGVIACSTWPRRMAALEPSATLAMAARAGAMKAEGIDVIDLSVGEPDFPTPAHICRAAAEAIAAGLHQVHARRRHPALRKAVAADYTPADRAGGHARPGDRLQRGQARPPQRLHRPARRRGRGDRAGPLLGQLCRTRQARRGPRRCCVETGIEDDFKLPPEALAAAITPQHADAPALLAEQPHRRGLHAGRTRGPGRRGASRPTWRSCPTRSTTSWSSTAARALLSDPAAGPGGPHGGGGGRQQDLLDDRLADRLDDRRRSRSPRRWRSLQSQETSNPSSISQHAAVAALTGPQECVAAMRDAFQVRRDLVAGRLRRCRASDLPEIGGAFYAFFDIRRSPRQAGTAGISTSLEWCEALLERQQVALVAGSAFGAEGHVRMSFRRQSRNSSSEDSTGSPPSSPTRPPE